jgi:hypothetical protein
LGGYLGEGIGRIERIDGIEGVEDPPLPIGYSAAREAEMLIFRVGVKGRADDGAVAVPGGERADHGGGEKRVPGGVYGGDEGARGDP